jgi:hypothetical protein
MMLGAFYVNVNRVDDQAAREGFKTMVTKGALIGEFSENRGMIGRSMTLSHQPPVQNEANFPLPSTAV